MFALLVAGLMLGREAAGAIGAGAWFAMACGACALALVRGGGVCRVGLGAAVVAFGAGWFTLRIHEAPLESLAGRFPSSLDTPVLITVEGIVSKVEDAPQPPPSVLPPMSFVRKQDRFYLSVRAIEGETGWVAASGIVRADAKLLDVRSLRAGDVVRVRGVGTAPPGRMNPGDPPWGLRARERGVVAFMHAASIARIEDARLGMLDRVRSRWWRWRQSQHDRAESLLLGGAGHVREGRALLGAIVLGVREGDVERTQLLFTRQGLGHLLAISGFHVAAMAGVTLVVVRLSGDHGRLEPLIVGVLVAAYLVILPARASILRAGFMVLALLAAESAGRRYDRVTILGWIACLLALWRPLEVWSLGFQLTFGVTAGLMLLYRPVLARMQGELVLVSPRPVRAWWRRWVVDPGATLFAGALVAWMVAVPTVIFHTGVVTPVSILTSMVVTPIVGLCLWLSFLAIGVGLLVPAAAAPVSWVLGLVAGSVIELVRVVDGVPGTTFWVADVGVAWTIGATVVGVYLLVRGHWRDARSWVFGGLVIAWLAIRIGPGTALPGGVLLRVDTLSVGDGTCHLVRSGNAAMLWDCGSTSPGIGLRNVPHAVRACGAGGVRTAVVTHSNYDHYSGLPDAARALGLRTVLVGPSVEANAGTGMMKLAIDSLRAQGVEVREVEAGDSFALGRARVEFLSPPGEAYASDNDNSLVARVTVRDEGRSRRVLLTGDIEAPAINALLEGDVRAEVLEVPHHGSANEATLRLVAESGATVVLQSTGLRRANDDRLLPAMRGRRWYTTATDGAAWVELRRSGVIRSGSVWRGEVEDRVGSPRGRS